MTIETKKITFSVGRDLVPLIKQAGLEVRSDPDFREIIYLIDRHTAMMVYWESSDIPSFIRIGGPTTEKVAKIIDSAFPKLRIIIAPDSRSRVSWFEWFFARRL